MQPVTSRSLRTGMISVLWTVLATCMFSSVATAEKEHRTFHITEFGAIGDGKTVNTKAINDAVTACNAAGGGTVIVPAGVFVSGGIRLLSNVELHLAHGSVLRASTNLRDFRENPAMIRARNAENVAVTGTGVINVMSVSFMDTTRIKTTENPPDYDKKYIRQGEKYMDPAFGLEHGPWTRKGSPDRTIDLIETRHATLRDVTIVNTVDWSVRVMSSEYVDIHGLKMHNHMMTPYSDGIHISSGRNITVSDCYIEGGDDAMVITAFLDSTMNSENITVTNCILRSRSSGIRIGWGDNNVIRNCVFSNLVIHGSNRGIGVFARKNGSIENIHFDNITIEAKMHKGHWWGHGEAIHVSSVLDPGSTAYLKNIRFSNITARGDNGVLIHGFENSPLSDVGLDGIKLTITNSPYNEVYGGNFDLRPTPLAKDGIFKHDIPAVFCGYADRVTLRNIEVEWEDGLPPFYTGCVEADHATNLIIDGVRGRQAHLNGSAPVILIRNSSAPTVRNCTAARGSGTFLAMENVRDERLFVFNDLSRAKKAFATSAGKFTASGNLLPVSDDK